MSECREVVCSRDEIPFYEKLGRGFIDIVAGRWSPSVRLGKRIGGLFSDDEIMFLLGNTSSGKTEMMHLLSDSQFAPFFWGTQHHADEKTPGEQEDEIQLGCTYVVTNDGPGVEGVKRNRMSQVANSLDRYMIKEIGGRSKTKIEQMNYTIPVYVVFTCNISSEPWDMIGLSAELRMFKEKVLGCKYFYIEEDKNANVKQHVANSVSEGERGKELRFAPKFLVVGTHLDKISLDRRNSSSDRFDEVVSQVMEREFEGNCFYRTVTADIRSMDGRQAFMKIFEKRMKEFHA